MLRRVMGKKKPEELAKNFVLFQEGAKKKGFSDAAIQALWDVLVPFAGYAFNKAHSSAYGLVTYWTAYLKANYPAEYMAALLTSVKDDKDKSAVYLNECRRMKIKVLPPDVNESVHNFAAQGDDVILFGLEAVRNVGSNVVESIVRARKAKGKFTSFPDYLDKIEAAACNKRTTESLIKAGAFDAMNHTRKGLTAQYEPMIDNVVAVKRKEAEGQFDLFGGMGEGESDEPGFGLDVEFSTDEWDKTYLLAQEREMLGLYVSDHPLFGLEHVLSDKADAGIGQLTGGDFGDGAVVTVGGIISGLQRKMTKQGNAWAIATVEDLAGSIECMFFPATYQLVSTQLVEDAVVFVKGRLDKREDVPRLVAMEMQVPDLSNAGTNAPVILTIPALRVTPPMINRLGEILTNHRGDSEVRIKLQGPRKTTVLRLDRHRVKPDPALYGDLKVLLGPSCLMRLTAPRHARGRTRTSGCAPRFVPTALRGASVVTEAALAVLAGHVARSGLHGRLGLGLHGRGPGLLVRLSGLGRLLLMAVLLTVLGHGDLPPAGDLGAEVASDSHSRRKNAFRGITVRNG